MSGSIESRVERRFMEIEERLRRHGMGSEMPHPDKLVPTNYIDEKIERYKSALETALRNAPCAGCRRLVLASLTGLAIYEHMDGKQRSEISDDEIERIKKEVERKYQNY